VNISSIVGALSRFHNVVLEGVPGVGKTIAVDRVARSWHLHTGRPLGGDGKGDWAATLHPSTAYEDFVEGLRPVGEADADDTEIRVLRFGGETTVSGWFASDPGGTGEFQAADGFFLRACKRALAQPDHDHLVLLDELNRANIPKVLGDLLTTLEHTKRAPWTGTAWDVRDAAVVALPYTGRPFFVPANLYVVATTNTSDRSVAVMDAALRRRFAFVRLEPLGEGPLEAAIRTDLTGPAAAVDAAMQKTAESIAPWRRLNDDLLRPCLGPDAVLGHSYLFALARALLGTGDDALPSWDADPTLAAVHRLMLSGRTRDGRPIRRAIWMELGRTGGSQTQADLPKKGVRDPGRGQPQLLTGDPSLAATSGTRSIRVAYEGDTKDTELKYFGGGPGYGGANPNMMWRWQKLPPGLIDPLDPTAPVVVMLERAPGDFEVHKVPPAARPVLEAASDWDRSPTGKHWGSIRLSKPQDGSAAAAVRDTWRFEVLPQLADTMVAGSAEVLLDPDRREEWFEGRAEIDDDRRAAALAALEAFDAWIASLGLRVGVSGTGVGRAPLIEDAPALPSWRCASPLGGDAPASPWPGTVVTRRPSPCCPRSGRVAPPSRRAGGTGRRS